MKEEKKDSTLSQMANWAVIISGIVYIASIDFKTTSNAAAIDHIEHDRAIKMEVFDAMRVDMAVVKKQVSDTRDMVQDFWKRDFKKP